MEGLPKGILQGIPWFRKLLLWMIAVLPAAVRQRHQRKDNCKGWAKNIQQVVTKLMMWLVKARDIAIGILQET